MKVPEEFYTFFKKNNDKVGILFPSFLIKKATYLIYIFLKYGSHFVQNSICNHNPHLHFKTLISNFSIPANILKYSFFTTGTHIHADTTLVTTITFSHIPLPPNLQIPTYQRIPKNIFLELAKYLKI